MRQVHIIGGGLAGLSAAVELAGSGVHVVVHEAGPACGGRARSYEDKLLERRIDNGNHLLLASNKAAFRYLGLIGAQRTLSGPKKPVFPFVDLRDGGRWTLSLSQGKLPWWAFSARRRVPGMRLWELGSLLKVLRADEKTTVSQCLAPGTLSSKLLEPFAISALNTPCETGSAVLLGNVVRESLALGGRACVPWYASEGLSESFVDPAIQHLDILKAEVFTGNRVSQLLSRDGRIVGLSTSRGEIEIGPDDAVIMAVPAPVAKNLVQEILPDLTGPDEFESIINAHYRVPNLPHLMGSIAQAGFAGVVGGISEWVFVRGDVISVTVSAANRYDARGVDELTTTIWTEVRSVLDPVLETPLPQAPMHARVVREKRATFAATPEQDKLRPHAATAVPNLVLAGDWTATGLPSTIEGAIRSGVMAVDVLRGSMMQNRR